MCESAATEWEVRRLDQARKLGVRTLTVSFVSVCDTDLGAVRGGIHRVTVRDRGWSRMWPCERSQRIHSDTTCSSQTAKMHRTWPCMDYRMVDGMWNVRHETCVRYGEM
jgi:hypothetical protein